jgi:hypothetical protein
MNNLKRPNNILSYYLLFPALLINQKTKMIIATTIITPTQTPALKISPIAWQLLSVNANTNMQNKIGLKFTLFIFFYKKLGIIFT